MFLPKAFFIVAATLNAQQALEEDDFFDLDTEINQLVLGDDLEETDVLLFSDEEGEIE